MIKYSVCFAVDLAIGAFFHKFHQLADINWLNDVALPFRIFVVAIDNIVQ
jgi:hypothetical protein